LLREDNLEILNSIEIVGLARALRAKYKEVEVMYRQILAIYKKVLRYKYLSTLASINNLAGVLNS
jgi:hypothetical protein